MSSQPVAYLPVFELCNVYRAQQLPNTTVLIDVAFTKDGCGIFRGRFSAFQVTFDVTGSHDARPGSGYQAI